jgi:hypothetical protein
MQSLSAVAVQVHHQQPTAAVAVEQEDILLAGLMFQLP